MKSKLILQTYYSQTEWDSDFSLCSIGRPVRFDLNLWKIEIVIQFGTRPLCRFLAAGNIDEFRFKYSCRRTEGEDFTEDELIKLKVSDV